MTWHGQINRTIWEIETLIAEKPTSFRLRRELLRTHFLQRYEYDRSLHIPRDDRSFLFLQENRAAACLLLHGAHGTPAEMRDLGNYLYGRGFTVYCPRFSRYDMKNRLVSWESWVTMAENALTTTLQYSKRTAVIGMSLGGTVSMILERMHTVAAMVLLAPGVYPRFGWRAGIYGAARRIVPALFYKLAGWNGEAVKAMDHLRKTAAPVRAPALALQARDDHVVSARGMKLLRKWFSHEGSDVVLLRQGSHALTRGSARSEIFEKVYEFAKQIQPVKSRGRRPEKAAAPDEPDRPRQRRERTRRRRSGRPRGEQPERREEGRPERRRGGERRSRSGAEPERRKEGRTERRRGSDRRTRREAGPPRPDRHPPSPGPQRPSTGREPEPAEGPGSRPSSPGSAQPSPAREPGPVRGSGWDRPSPGSPQAPGGEAPPEPRRSQEPDEMEPEVEPRPEEEQEDSRKEGTRRPRRRRGGRHRRRRGGGSQSSM